MQLFGVSVTRSSLSALHVCSPVRLSLTELRQELPPASRWLAGSCRSEEYLLLPSKQSPRAASLYRAVQYERTYRLGYCKWVSNPKQQNYLFSIQALWRARHGFCFAAAGLKYSKFRSINNDGVSQGELRQTCNQIKPFKPVYNSMHTQIKIIIIIASLNMFLKESFLSPYTVTDCVETTMCSN